MLSGVIPFSSLNRICLARRRLVSAIAWRIDSVTVSGSTRGLQKGRGDSLCGVGAGLAFVLSDPSSTTGLIGASGAVSGVVAAYLLFRPCAKVTCLLGLIPLRLRAYWIIGGWAIWQFVDAASRTVPVAPWRWTVREAPPGEPANAAMRFRTDGYGTVSSALIALPAVPTRERRPVFRFAEWLPAETPWREVG